MANDIDTKELEDAMLVRFFLSDADQARLMDHWAWEEQRIAAQNKMLRDAAANAETGLKTGIKSGLNHVETAYYPSGHHLGGYDLGWGLGWSDDMWGTLYANPVPDDDYLSKAWKDRPTWSAAPCMTSQNLPSWADLLPESRVRPVCLCGF